MTRTIEELHARKSVRAYTDEPITDEQKQAILLAATAAPTAGNQQLYTIIDIVSPELKQQLSVSCDNQPFIAEAPMVLVFCADCRKWYDMFAAAGCEPRRPGAGDLLLAVSDANIAAQNAVVAAESMGIGSCYIGDIMENCETQRALLNLPEYVFPAAMLVFGWPTVQQKEREKPVRCRLEDIVCQDRYEVKDADALKAMFEYKRGQLTYEEWAARFCNRKYNSDFAREMTCSVEEYLKQFK